MNLRRSRGLSIVAVALFAGSTALAQAPGESADHGAHHPDQQAEQPTSETKSNPQMMGSCPQMMGGSPMMGKMMGPGMRGRGMMGRGMCMRIMFALMDTDGDGTLSLEEFQAAHAKIFKVIDANQDGKVAPAEMGMFMRGAGSPSSGGEQDEDDWEEDR
jgi:hypothetical protein